MNRQQAITLIERIYEGLLEPEYQAKIPEMYHPDVILEIDGQIAHYQDIIDRADYRQKHYQSIRSEIKDVVVDDDKIAIRIKQEPIFKGDKADCIYQATLIYQIQAGKIIKVSGNFTPHLNYCVRTC